MRSSPFSAERLRTQRPVSAAKALRGASAVGPITWGQSCGSAPARGGLRRESEAERGNTLAPDSLHAHRAAYWWPLAATQV